MKPTGLLLILLISFDLFFNLAGLLLRHRIGLPLLFFLFLCHPLTSLGKSIHGYNYCKYN